jgi:mannose-6-phosphate isomerase-like protein (cupin superfamily)
VTSDVNDSTAVSAEGRGFEALGADIGTSVSVIAVDAAPGTGPRLHRHPYDEVFVVLEGEATFTLGDAQRVARAGEVVVAPAGVAHAFLNTGSTPLRQVDVHVSPRFETEWLASPQNPTTTGGQRS